MKLLEPYLGYIKMAGVIILVLLSVGIYFYVDNLQKDLTKTKVDLAVSQENERKLEESIDEQKELIKSKDDEIKQIKGINSTLRGKIISQKNHIFELNKKFTVSARGQTRDFGAIARVKPGLVNKLINKGTLEANRCLELSTGVKLKDGESYENCIDIINFK